MKNKIKILICGGAGYIGSHMAKMLSNLGYDIVCFDNLSTGNRWALKWGEFVKGDLLNHSDLQHLFSEHQFDLVIHFSAKAIVEESIKSPDIYYKNNVIGTYNLIEKMLNNKINKFIFSSTAAVYGDPITELISETHPKSPINPYGHSKLIVEYMLEDYAIAYGLNSVILRYFNVAGADPDCEIGEYHEHETHLIPNILITARSQLEKHDNNKKSEFIIYGDDFPTKDGTCVRDYIHVNDICTAHVKAINYINDLQGTNAFNLGNGQGFTIKEILNAAENIIGRKVNPIYSNRRDGDPAILVADSSKATNKLDWKPKYRNIESIIETAWKWQINMPV
ncbi:MAG: UDP-glucose 4-epimerase GalE [Proteobacteria bacterium]|nr:UDP-glucose 4-epimerase GalE [Pseudomonadota bacterium]